MAGSLSRSKTPTTRRTDMGWREDQAKRTALLDLLEERGEVRFDPEAERTMVRIPLNTLMDAVSMTYGTDPNS